MANLGNWALFSFHVDDLGVSELATCAQDPENCAPSLNNLKNLVKADEAFYLATCNRVEYLFFAENPMDFERWNLKSKRCRKIEQLGEVIQHLLKVAVGRDSVVVGENQILGQFKAAMNDCTESNSLGPVLNSVLRMIVREAKSIRSKVKVKNFPTSISTIAGQLLINKVQDHTAKILLVGYSETNQILYRYLTKWNYKNIYWTNRTDSHLENDNSFDTGKIVHWSDFKANKLSQFSVVCLATRAPNCLLSEEALNMIRPHLVFDLAVPANAERSLVEKFSAEYVGIDEINSQLSHKRRDAEAQLELVDDYILLKTELLLGEIIIRFSKDVFSQLVEEAEKTFERQLNSAIEKQFSDLDENSVLSIEKWSRQLVRKITHKQLETLKTIVPKSINHE